MKHILLEHNMCTFQTYNFIFITKPLSKMLISFSFFVVCEKCQNFFMAEFETKRLSYYRRITSRYHTVILL